MSEAVDPKITEIIDGEISGLEDWNFVVAEDMLKKICHRTAAQVFKQFAADWQAPQIWLDDEDTDLDVSVFDQTYRMPLATLLTGFGISFIIPEEEAAERKAFYVSFLRRIADAVEAAQLQRTDQTNHWTISPNDQRLNAASGSALSG